LQQKVARFSPPPSHSQIEEDFDEEDYEEESSDEGEDEFYKEIRRVETKIYEAKLNARYPKVHRWARGDRAPPFSEKHFAFDIFVTGIFPVKGGA
jgi:hypothetical protein